MLSVKGTADQNTAVPVVIQEKVTVVSVNMANIKPVAINVGVLIRPKHIAAASVIPNCVLSCVLFLAAATLLKWHKDQE